MVIRTLDYGVLPIAHSKAWLADNLIDVIEDGDGRYYEVRQTVNGKLVALEVEI